MGACGSTMAEGVQAAPPSSWPRPLASGDARKQVASATPKHAPATQHAHAHDVHRRCSHSWHGASVTHARCVSPQHVLSVAASTCASSEVPSPLQSEVDQAAGEHRCTRPNHRPPSFTHTPSHGQRSSATTQMMSVCSCAETTREGSQASSAAERSAVHPSSIRFGVTSQCSVSSSHYPHTNLHVKQSSTSGYPSLRPQLAAMAYDAMEARGVREPVDCTEVDEYYDEGRPDYADYVTRWEAQKAEEEQRAAIAAGVTAADAANAHAAHVPSERSLFFGTVFGAPNNNTHGAGVSTPCSSPRGVVREIVVQPAPPAAPSSPGFHGASLSSSSSPFPSSLPSPEHASARPPHSAPPPFSLLHFMAELVSESERAGRALQARRNARALAHVSNNTQQQIGQQTQQQIAHISVNVPISRS